MFVSARAAAPARSARRAFARRALADVRGGSGARAEELDEGVPFKSVALQGNPLGLVIGRYSADLEYLPAPHHALHLDPASTTSRCPAPTTS